MENDLCQNHPLHNYNMLITYFIKEVYYGLADEIMQAKDTWRKSSDAWISLSLFLTSSAVTLRSHLPLLSPLPSSFLHSSLFVPHCTTHNVTLLNTMFNNLCNCCRRGMLTTARDVVWCLPLSGSCLMWSVCKRVHINGLDAAETSVHAGLYEIFSH